MTTLFANTVTLRGFLGSNAEAPPSDGITEDAYAVLLLATVSGIWDLSTNQWTPRTDWHRVICPGPFFCGMVRGMRRGDYLEVEGELRSLEQERGVVVAGERFPVKHTTYAVHAIAFRGWTVPKHSSISVRTANTVLPTFAEGQTPLRFFSDRAA